MNLKKIYTARKENAHKGDFGYVLIMAGSEMYSGSPIFNAMSALRCGADLVTVAGHRRAMDVVAAYRPDMITFPLEGEFEEDDVSNLMELSQGFDTLVMGGGMKRSEESFLAIRKLIQKIDLPMVLDAEAIRAVAGHEEILKGKQAVLTPNIPEFEYLTGEKVGDDIEERQTKVKVAAEKLGAVVILKGATDVISDGERTLLNRTGNAFMSKGGFGDTLAGICGALLARGTDPLEAAEAACYINGSAGEMAGVKYGESLLASDLFEYFPRVINGE